MEFSSVQQMWVPGAFSNGRIVAQAFQLRWRLPMPWMDRRQDDPAGYFAPIPAIAFTSRYSSNPNRPHSRPLPDCL